MSTSTALPKQYDPSEVEPRWLSFWLENGFFHADAAAPNVPYSITLPPPNVTGSLHIGHALGSSMQDILMRWKRMQGFNAMWMPGIDHASIAVHVLIEKDLKRREQKTRFDLGREEFMRRAWKWKERSGSRIGEQEKLMGFSLDWQRERFTMDERSNLAVREADGQLGSGERDRGLGSRGRHHRGERPPLGHQVRRRHRRRHDASRNHARRYRGRGAPRRRALQAPRRQASPAASHRPHDPDRGRQLRRSEV